MTSATSPRPRLALSAAVLATVLGASAAIAACSGAAESEPTDSTPGRILEDRGVELRDDGRPDADAEIVV